MLWITLLDSSWSRLLWNPPFNFVTFSPTCQKWINEFVFQKLQITYHTITKSQQNIKKIIIV